MQVHDSARGGKLPLPPHGGDYLDEWLSKRELKREWGVFERTGGFLPQFRIITHDREGRPRPELSALRIKNGEPKYKNPPGSGVVIYAPQPDSFRRFANAREKWIAEGQGKVLALVGLDLPALGIGGCAMWHPPGDSTRLHPDLQDHIRDGDVVNVVMDGDFREKEAVRSNAAQLLFHLRAMGAKPRLLNLAADQKIDDLIASWRRDGKDPKAELDKLGFLSDVPSKLKLTSDAEILARPPPEWIVKYLIPPVELTAIVGETSCGKTFFTMDLLLAVARGEAHWFGQRIKRHGTVVHITLEGTSLGNRRRAYSLHHKLTEPLPYVALEVPVNLRDTNDADAVIRSIRELGTNVALIAVDTVNRAFSGGDENSSADMGAFLASCERIKTAFPGCGVLLVHHQGKDASRGARGHSSFSASVGAELRVEHDEKSGIRTVSIIKQREGRTDLRFNFALEIVELGKDEDGEAITSCVVVPSSAPVVPPDVGNRERYIWMLAWYRGDQNRGKPVSKRRIGENLVNIAPKGIKVRRAELEATFVWAIDKGLATRANEQPKNGDWYELAPHPDPKY